MKTPQWSIFKSRNLLNISFLPHQSGKKLPSTANWVERKKILPYCHDEQPANLRLHMANLKVHDESQIMRE